MFGAVALLPPHRILMKSPPQPKAEESSNCIIQLHIDTMISVQIWPLFTIIYASLLSILPPTQATNGHSEYFPNTSAMNWKSGSSYGGIDGTDHHHWAARRLQTWQRQAIIDELLPIRVKKPLIEAHQHQIYSDVNAIAGRMARLPCYVRPLGPADSLSLVLWYRGEDISGTPIYSIDSRYTTFDRAQYFTANKYQSREIVNFTLDTAYSEEENSMNQTAPKSTSTAHLYLMPVVESDAGLYWCRVDYKWERTTISTVTMNVIVPPRQLQILLLVDGGKAIRLAPNETITLNEDSTATLICLSEGGKPLPILNWYRNEELIRSEIFHSLTESNQTLQSELHLTTIRAIDHNIPYKCLSSNDNQTFLSSQIRLRVNSKPSRVEIVPANMNESAIVVGSDITAICRSYGSRPAANHTWTILPSGRILDIVKQNILVKNEFGDWENEEAMTESIVQFVPQAEDNGQLLVCEARNSLLKPATGYLESDLRINIAFAPKVSLQQLVDTGQNSSPVVSSLSPGFAVRGDQLQLHCNISANPAVDRVLWYRNSVKIADNHVDNSGPVEVTHNGTRLVINNITDSWQGFYQCVAHNNHGSGFSNQFQVQILYRPECVTPTQTIPANIGSVVTMICDVAANPSNVSFHWRTKHKDLAYEQSSFEVGGVMIKNRGLKSRLEIRVENVDDFGQYSCLAHNLAGIQEEPCYYNIYENTIKQLVCETNITWQTIQVECQHERPASSIGGNPLEESNNRSSFNVIQQASSTTVHFNLKIYQNQKQLINITSIEPHFLVHVSELDSTNSPFSSSQEMADSTLQRELHSENRAQVEPETEEDEVATYLMLISAITNGRLTSDISLSFKVPPPAETDQSVVVDTDQDADSHPNVTISRLKKIFPLNESLEPRGTNAESFTTAATIRQLPLIWTIFSLIVFVLIVSILIVLGRLYVKRRRRKPTVHFCDSPTLADVKCIVRKSSDCDSEEEETTAASAAAVAAVAVDKNESIQLFTLANFDQINSYEIGNHHHQHQASKCQGPVMLSAPYSVTMTASGHVNLRPALPDLIQSETFDYSLSTVDAAETGQHNLYIIPDAASIDGSKLLPTNVVTATTTTTDFVAPMSSFGSSGKHGHYCSGDEWCRKYDTLPNRTKRASLRIENPYQQETKTPSMDQIHWQ